jgi:hypothetical protein
MKFRLRGKPAAARTFFTRLHPISGWQRLSCAGRALAKPHFYPTQPKDTHENPLACFL